MMYEMEVCIPIAFLGVVELFGRLFFCVPNANLTTNPSVPGVGEFLLGRQQ